MVELRLPGLGPLNTNINFRLKKRQIETEIITKVMLRYVIVYTNTMWAF